MQSVSTTNLDLIYSLFSQITPITPDDIQEVARFLKRETYKKDEYILEIGQTETRVSIVSKGIVHMFTYIDDEVFTINISMPGKPYNSLDSYIFNRPSNEIQQAVTDVEILFLEKEEIEYLMHNNNTFCYIYAKLYEHVLCERELRTLLLQYNSASKRYEFFLESFADSQFFLKEVPQKLVAQYLGLAPETLCRVKNQYLKKH